MNFRKGPNVVIKVLVCIVLMPVLAAWVIPCHEDAPLHQGSPSHNDCCGGHSVPFLSSAAAAPQVSLSMTVFHPFDQQFVPKIFASDIYRPPRA
jgi:hypothetical protein